MPVVNKPKSKTKSLRTSPSSSDTITATSLTTSPKNYQSAFTTLTSSYGFCGALLSLPHKVKKEPTATKLPLTTQPLNSEVPVNSSGKIFEFVFGTMSSSYGVNGVVPSWLRKA